MTRFRTLMLAVLVGGFFVSPVHAAMFCGDRDDIVQALRNGHEEQPAADGLTASGAVIELFSSADGTWTLLMTIPDGRTCLLSSGTNWEFIKPVKPSEES